MLATLVVNTTGDGNDPTAPTLSLREAIEVSNNDGSLPLASLSAPARAQVSGSFTAGVPNVIDFQLGGPGVQTIRPATALPHIASPLVIDGYYKTGAMVGVPATLTVRIDGAAASLSGAGAVNGLDVEAPNCVINGLIITGFSGAGVSISGADSHGDWLWGNVIGTMANPAPGQDYSNDRTLSNGTGVLVTASNDLIGGGDVGLRNVINNNGIGLVLDTQTGIGTLVESNLILDNVTEGVLVSSSNNTIGRETAGGGNAISGNGKDGILITGDPVNNPYTVDTGGTGGAGNRVVQGNNVYDNVIGPDVTGNRPRISPYQQERGVRIEDSPGNNIGGILPGGLNVIAGHQADGIEINGPASTGNRVVHNWIGFSGGTVPPYNGPPSSDQSNLTYLPNEDGITVTSSGNVIGGTDPGAGNTISNNRRYGVRLIGPGASGNTIQGNIVGLTPTGDTTLGNAFDGVRLDGAPGNLIGGPTVAARNVISGNNRGIDLNGAGATGNVVQGNFIGTAADGVTDLGNAVEGLVLDNAPANTIGGTDTAITVTSTDPVTGNVLTTLSNVTQGNVISGNNLGIRVSGPGATGERILGNYVGTDLTGKAFLHNETVGILVTAGASGNAIGGAAQSTASTSTFTGTTGYTVRTDIGPALVRNIISNNLAGGVNFDGTSGNGNTVLDNTIGNNNGAGVSSTAGSGTTVQFDSIYGNAGPGINVVNQAPPPNNVPILTFATPSTGSDFLAGSINDPAAPNTTFTVQYFATPGARPLPGFEQGQTLLYTAPVTTDAAGHATLGLRVPQGIPAGEWFTATATDPQGNTSAFSTIPTSVQLGVSVVAVNENAGSLRFTVNRNSPVGTASVNFATADGTARAGVNYTATSGTLTFNPGETTKVVTVPVLDDGVVTGPLKFSLALSNPVNVVLGSPAATSVSVINTDTPGGGQSPFSLTITVNTTSDENDPADGTISLREAIELSNGTLPFSALSPAEQALVAVTPVPPATGSSPPVPNTINFDIPGSGVQTIQVGSPLPAITAPALIHGYSQPGSAVSGPTHTEADLNSALVQIDGSALPPGQFADGLAITTSNCEVSGLIVTGFHDAGISISDPAVLTLGRHAQGNWLWGNFLGALPDPVGGSNFQVDPLNAAGLSQPQLGNQGEGVRITSPNNRVGGNTPGSPNVMANNGYDASGTSVWGVGILLDGRGATGNLIQGNAVLFNADQGILVHSSNNTIGEALVGGGNVVAGNGGPGIEITDPAGGVNSQGNQVLGNFLGTDLGSADNTVMKGTVRRPNSAQGVLILNSPKNTVGGYTPAARNVIGSNLLDGVEIDGPTSIGNRLLNNDIGFNVVNGLIALLPNQNGVSITSSGNFVGDPTTPGGGNTISDNRGNGVLLLNAGATGNVIAGNVIGLNPAGGSAFPNGFDGVHIDNAPGNFVGVVPGATAAKANARNTISANNNGVSITGPNATGNVIDGNFIGTAIDGVTDLGNAVDGVVIDNAPGNTVGGSDATPADPATVSSVTLGNVISGNNRGVRVTGAGSRENRILGNFIGTDLTRQYDLSNAIDGVLMTAGASNNTVGGPLPAAGNSIEFDAGEGVNLDSGTGNAVLSNAIVSNTASGGALPGGIALNPAAGANDLQPAPVLTTVVPNGKSTTVQGTLTARPNTTYTLQFFSSDAQDRSGFGQGESPVLATDPATVLPGYTTDVTTDAAGRYAIALNLPSGVPSGRFLTATATDTYRHNTSAFSNAVIAVPVSLRLGQATYTANESSGVVTVTVVRTGGTGGAVSVNYNVDGGTATPGVDYAPTTGTLTFAPGVTSQTFTVPILEAHKVGGSVTANITLGSFANGATAGTPVVGTLTIQDNDQPAVGFPAASQTFYGPGVAYILVTRNTPTGSATVRYATSDGSALAGVNYTPASGSVTFSPGQTTQYVPVTLLDDSQAHAAPLTFGLTLGQPTGAVLGPVASLVVSDVTTASPGVFQLAAASTAAAPGATVASVTVVRTGGKTGAVTVAYATGGGNARPGVDYTPVSGTLSFAPGETAKVVYVRVLNTNTPAASPSFLFGLGNPTGGATLGPQVNTNVTILHPSPGAAGPVNSAPPTVSDVLPVAGPAGFYKVVITFNKPMDAARASSAANYALSLNGRPVPIFQAGYDPTANHVVLSLGAAVPFGSFARLDIRGLTDTAGNLFDGSGTGHSPGSPYAALIGEGHQLYYADRSGDSVGLNLAGPGFLALTRGLDGEAQSLRFVGTTANLSTLTGAVVARPGTPGTTSIPSISGAAGVRIRLASPPFYLGGITATAFDSLAVSGGLKALTRR